MPTHPFIIYLLVLASLVCGSALAADKPSTQADFEKLQDQVRTLDKELAVQKEAFIRKLDDVEKRQAENTAKDANSLAAISNQTATVGNYIANTSILITILVLLAGFITYFSAKGKAEIEARVASKQWFDDHAAYLKAEIENLRAAALAGSGQIKSQVAQFEADAEAERQKVAEAGRSLLQTTPITTGNAPTDVTNQLAVATVQDARQALKTKPESEFTASDFYARGLAYFSENNYQSALSSFENAIKLADSHAAHAELARYLFAKGITLGQLDKFAEEIAVYDELVRRFGADTTPAVREQVAKGLVNKGITLGQLDKFTEEIAVYDELVQRFGLDTAPAVRERVASGLVNKGFRLGQLDKSAEEMAVYDELVQRFGADTTPAVREQVAKGLVHKGLTLGQLDKSAEEIAVYDELLQRFGLDTTPAVREQVAKGLVNKGITLGQLDKFTEEIAVYDELVQRFGLDITPAMHRQVAKALFNKGNTLGQLDKSAEAIAVYDELVQRFGADTTPAVRGQVANGLVNKGNTLGQLDKFAEAIAVYDELVQRFGADTTPAVREQVASGLVNKGVTLGKLDKFAEETAVYDELVQRFGADTTPAVREQVAIGLFNKGVTLGKLDKSAEAITVYDELVQRFGIDTAPAVREQVVRAQNDSGFNRIILSKKYWHDEARRVELLGEAIVGLKRAASECSDETRAMVLGNLGYSLFLAGDRMAANAPTLECLQLGGQKMLDAQREDAKLHRVEPEDSQYEELLNKLWQSLPPEATQG